MKMPAAEFKAKCLSLMDHVNLSHEEVIITKHGKAVAKLVPISETPEKPLFGFLGKKAQLADDLIESIDIEWEAAK